jgi:hypothetical protein
MRKHSATLVAAAIAILVIAGGAAAATRFVITNINQIKPSVRAQLRGSRGPRGPVGFGQVTDVLGRSFTLQPGQSNVNISDDVNCPTGAVVVGTGLNDGGVLTVGFVESFHTFVDGFVTDNTAIAASYNWQAICAQSSGFARDARDTSSVRQMKLAAFRSYQASH